MALFILRESGRPDRRYEIPRRDSHIGRAESCELILPNVSVSRKHAQIQCVGLEYQIKNISTKSELLVNGEAVQEKILATGDEILIGKFTLLFYGDRLNPGQQLLDGRMLSEYPGYRVNVAGPVDSTFQLSAAQVKRMREMMHRQRVATVRRKGDAADHWKPEDRTLTFGKKETVPVKGWLAGGVAATLEWMGTGHTLKKSGIAKVRVNGENITERQLKNGDEFTVGGSDFVYAFEE